MKKVLVWGMGNTYQHWKEWFQQVEIIAFINDSPQNKTYMFEGKPVIHSYQIKEYEYDAIVVVVANINNIYSKMQELIRQGEEIEILSYKENICEIDEKRDIVTVSFNNLANVGDQLNSFMLDNLFNINVVMAPASEAQVMAIGSVLEELCNTKNKEEEEDDSIAVWGTGFISDHKEELSFIRKVNICALRGEKSKAIVEKILGHTVDCVLADAGLLVSKLYPVEEKVFDIGIVPHYVDLDSEVIENALRYYDNATLIDVTKNPSDVIRKIAQCKTVISSSLHGLIIADSFGIPNKWIRCSNKIIGNSFKFDDYYSSFNQQVDVVDINKRYPSIKEIEEDYCIQSIAVQRKQRQLLQCFPL